MKPCKDSITIDNVVACILAKPVCKHSSDRKEVHHLNTSRQYPRVERYYRCNKIYNNGLRY